MRGQLNPPIPIILQSITTKKDKKPESSAHATNIKTKSAKKSLIPPPVQFLKNIKNTSYSFLIKVHDSDSY